MGEAEAKMLRESILGSTQVGPHQNHLISELSKGIENVKEYLNHLEMGLVQLSNALQQVSIETNACRQTDHLLFNILIENKIIEKEILQERYKTEVAEPIREAIVELENKAKERLGVQNED